MQPIPRLEPYRFLIYPHVNNNFMLAMDRSKAAHNPKNKHLTKGRGKTVRSEIAKTKLSTKMVPKVQQSTPGSQERQPKLTLRSNIKMQHVAQGSQDRTNGDKPFPGIQLTVPSTAPSSRSPQLLTASLLKTKYSVMVTSSAPVTASHNASVIRVKQEPNETGGLIQASKISYPFVDMMEQSCSSKTSVPETISTSSCDIRLPVLSSDEFLMSLKPARNSDKNMLNTVISALSSPEKLGLLRKRLEMLANFQRCIEIQYPISYARFLVNLMNSLHEIKAVQKIKQKPKDAAGKVDAISETSCQIKKMNSGSMLECLRNLKPELVLSSTSQAIDSIKTRSLSKKIKDAFQLSGTSTTNSSDIAIVSGENNGCVDKKGNEPNEMSKDTNSPKLTTPHIPSSSKSTEIPHTSYSTISSTPVSSLTKPNTSTSPCPTLTSDKVFVEFVLLIKCRVFFIMHLFQQLKVKIAVKGKRPQCESLLAEVKGKRRQCESLLAEEIDDTPVTMATSKRIRLSSQNSTNGTLSPSVIFKKIIDASPVSTVATAFSVV